VIGRLAAAFVALAVVGAAAAGVTTTPFDSSRAFEHMRQLVAIGPRPSGSAGIQQARDYIEAQLKEIGLTPQEQAFEAQTPFGVVRMANVIARIPGARPERILITGHFDTKLYRQFRFVGANDGGSSAAMLLELARVLKARKNAYTIELVFFDGEEAVLPEWGGTDHTYGSRHYVETAKRDGSIASIKAMILFDMIGDRNLTIYSTAKAGVLGLTRSLAREFGTDNIRVNCVVPGWIMTQRQIELWLTPEGEKNLIQSQCIKRKLYPDDVARLVLFLASDDSSGCTNQSYIIDGGRN